MLAEYITTYLMSLAISACEPRWRVWRVSSANRLGSPERARFQRSRRALTGVSRRVTGAKWRSHNWLPTIPTGRRSRTPNAFATARELMGMVAESRGWRPSTTDRVWPIHALSHEFERRTWGHPAEPAATTKSWGTPHPQNTYAHACATAMDGLGLQCLHETEAHPLRERAALACIGGSCVERHLRDHRRSRSIARYLRPISRAIQEPQPRPLKRASSERPARIHAPAAYGPRGWNRRASRERCKFGKRGTKNLRYGRRGRISDRLAATEAAGFWKRLTAPRATKGEPKQFGRQKPRHPGCDGHSESTAPCEPRFPLRSIRHRPGRIPSGDSIFDSGGLVRSLLSSVWKKSLDIQAAAGCCSWNLPGFVVSRLREKRKRNVTCKVRASRVPASQYLRMRQK